MPNLAKEYRRLAFQFRNLVRYGRLNPFGHTRRTRKPGILKRRPHLEIDSPLEFVIAHLGIPADQFFFVQIGAFDGITDDLLHTLIASNHWRGILVEPQPEAFQKLKETYAGEPQLIFRNVAIGNTVGEVPMYSLRTGPSQVTSFDRQNLMRHLNRAADIVTFSIPCMTLQALLSEAGCSHVDFLQIDAEGYDAEIIRSIDFRTLKPSIIRYEHCNLLPRDRDQLIEQLADEGYRFLLEDIDTIACLPAAVRQPTCDQASSRNTTLLVA